MYSFVAGLDNSDRRAAADRNGRSIFVFERRLHIDLEPALNRWLSGHELLRTVANYEYATSYVLAAFALLGWLYLRRPAYYRPARTTFVALNLIGIACFAILPVTPPRLLGDGQFVDTVADGRTWASWGSPLVAHANQLAAMPSLHVAWALWVSVALARIGAGRAVQLASAAHVTITMFVIVATANHYLLDAVGGIIAVWLAFVPWHRARPGRPDRVPAADAFFLHVESPIAAQHVGGLAVLDTSVARFSREALAAVVRAHLHELPRFRQQLSAASSRWRRPRWVERDELDWEWHVPVRDLTRPDGRPGGTAALHELVAELAATPLPRDRPLWRFVAVLGVEADRAAAVLIVHHVIADGVGTVAQALTLLEPRIVPELPAAGAGPGPLARAGGTVAGLAQLATDGFPRLRLPTGDAPRRTFATAELPLDAVRTVARRTGTRVSDVLMTAVAGGLSRIRPAFQGPLRVAVPLMVRRPGSAAEGNLTAAVMTDVPLGVMSEPERLLAVSRRSRSLYSGTRALASNFVMRRIGGLLPVPLHRWFARTVYGRRFFQAIVSNMPGPSGQLSLTGVPLAGVFPILPLAPGAPLAVGALGWNGTLSVGLCADPVLVPDARLLTDAMAAAFAELRAVAAPQAEPRGREGGGSAGVPAAVRDQTGSGL
ncbi:phosphatase PAP2 family protein [Dactylosporangium sp. CA-092794]|uniref:bifunctional phosphatase PAP2/O-acyltransferase family protein n=1 Tax=Dactylosporangium sp. CA-092794 TaxID=3239929 RepID=UPI003D8F8273